VEGKFFRAGLKKFHVRGISYGPFEPGLAGDPFASAERTAADFALIRELGANVLRIYHVPPRWFLDSAQQHDLRVLIDIPWNSHLCFLDSRRLQQEACEAVRNAVYATAHHPAIFAYSVVNEIPPDIVRWSGTQAVADFIDQLIEAAKKAYPDGLYTFGNFPPTEFLRPRAPDFYCFNLYLHQRKAFQAYLGRLQLQANDKPLLLGETGIDSLREGEEKKSEMLSWMLKDAYSAGLAGANVFSFTDDWWRGGRQIEDWEMGLTTRNRERKTSFFAVQKEFSSAPYYPLPVCPKVSVVVASYNADRTLKACLDSLETLNYPDYEVILVDDGSRDTTPQIAFQRSRIRYFRHEKNLGLAVARNTGIAAATGEIIAFTDADCRADEDWLYYLVRDLPAGNFAGVGGPNLLPPEDSTVAATVMASPGGPAHVMLNDKLAEHVPGCNMAFYKWALAAVDGFDPIFTKAGDDVDLCWRLQQAGLNIGFSPAGFVWHYRRSTVRDYLNQQEGYGQAEALLVRKHPEYFNVLGGTKWRGRIYTNSSPGLLLRAPIIYRGLFNSAGFSFLYGTEPSESLMLFTSLEYHVLVTLPLVVLGTIFRHLFPLALSSLVLSLGVCAIAAAQAPLPKNKRRWWSRPLVAMLFFLQPIVRGSARYQGRLLPQSVPLAAQQTLDSVALQASRQPLDELCFWAERRVDRLGLAAAILRKLDQQGWPNRSDTGWCDYDVEVYGSRWSSLQITTIAEEHAGGKQMIHCRLRPYWSLQARVIFWSLAGAELLTLGVLGPRFHWLWLLLLTLPAFAWYIHRDHRSLQSMIAIMLHEIAEEWNLTRIGEKPVLAKAPRAGSVDLQASPFREQQTPAPIEPQPKN
jgi:glycosyltransferase involved in cell wall biosynthesis